MKPSFIIEVENDNETYSLTNSTGHVVNSSINASEIINYAIANGKTVMLKGKIVLTAPVIVEKSSITITGENIAGDLFFTSEEIHHGFSNKWGTTIIADNFTAFEVGKTNFIFGVTIQNLGISGINSDDILSDTDCTAGAGIRAYKVDTFQISHVQVTRKDYGILLGTNGSYTKYNVIDVVTLDSIYLNYNLYGIYTYGWVANARLFNIWGYINQRGLIHACAQYDWVISNVFSNADGWKPGNETAANYWDMPIYITTSSDVTLNDIVVAGSKGTDIYTVKGPKSLIGLEIGIAKIDYVELFRAHITINRVTLFETDADAILIQGHGQVDITNIYAGSTGNSSFYGGPATIQGTIIKNCGLGNVSIHVNGGFANSNQSRFLWFWGILNGTVQNVRNYNPYGLFSNSPAFDPFCNGNMTLGLFTDNTSQRNPNANVTYKIVVTDVLITSLGGTGVNITITDPYGSILATDITELKAFRVPVGFGISWGNFTVAPTTLAVAGN